MKTCGDCYFYEQSGEGKNGKGETVTVGICYALPPQLAVNGSSSYPVVGKVERECGLFKPMKGLRK